MVSVPTQQRSQVLFMPVVIKKVIIQCRFLAGPLIESLIHHKKSHLVAEIEKLRRRRIMTGAKRVTSHLREHLELTLQRADDNGSAKRTEIMMIAYAV